MYLVQNIIYNSEQFIKLLGRLPFWLLLVIIVAPAQMKAQGLKALRSDSSVAEVSTPCLFTTAIVVSNSTGRTSHLIETISLPPTWQLLVPDTMPSLPSGETDIRILSFSIPVSTKPGRYMLVYSATCKEDTTIRTLCEIPVVVRSVLSVELTHEECPTRVLAGDRYQARYRVTNRSNTASRIHLVTKSTLGFEVQPPDLELNLQPGEIQRVTFSVITDRMISQKSPHQLTVGALIKDEAGDSVFTADKSIIVVIPRVRPKGDYYVRIPTRLATRFISDRNATALQVDWSGTGYLDEKGDYKVDFLIRGPRGIERNIYGLRSEYSARVQSKYGEVQVGDVSYSLSPLTEQSRFARGIRSAVYIGKGQVGGYYLKTTGTSPTYEQTALYAGYQVHPLFDLRLNFLKTATPLSSNVWGLASTVKPVHNMNIDVEYSLSSGNIPGTSLPNAGRVGVNGNFSGVVYRLEKVYAQPGYGGRYHDEDNTWATLSKPVSKSITLRTSYRILKRNLDLNAARGSILRDKHYGFGVNYAYSPNTLVSLDYESGMRDNHWMLSKLKYSADVFRLTARQSFENVSLNATVERGHADSEFAMAVKSQERYGLWADYNPTSWQHYTASFQTGNVSLIGIPVRNRIFGFTSDYKLGEKFSFALEYQRTDVDMHNSMVYHVASINLKYVLMKKHIFSLRIRSMSMENERVSKGTAVALSYEIPIGLPVGKKSSIGRLSGRILDNTLPYQAGLPDVILMMDDLTAVTDENGNYTFDGVKPGRHFLQVDESSIGVDRVTTSKLPMVVEIHGGKAEQVDCGITQGCTLRGNIAVFRTASGNSNEGILVESSAAEQDTNANPELIRAYSLQGVYLEVIGAQDTIICSTNKRGDFVLENLRPGTWTVRPDPSSLPAFHQYGLKDYQVELRSGAEENLAISVVPQKRSVITVDQGDVKVSGRK